MITKNKRPVGRPIEIDAMRGRVVIRIDEELYQKAKQVAQAKGYSGVSPYMRDVITKVVNEKYEKMIAQKAEGGNNGT